MACHVCYSPGGLCTKMDERQGFLTIVLPEGFDGFFCVPCSEVVHFNSVMNLQSIVDTPKVSMRTHFGQVYVVRLQKVQPNRRGRTMFFGGNLHRMISQYSLKAGDLIIICLHGLVDGQFRIFLHDPQGNEKHPIFLTDDASQLDLLFSKHYSKAKLTTFLDDQQDEMLVQFLYDFLDSHRSSFARPFVLMLVPGQENKISKWLIISEDLFEKHTLPDNGPVKICMWLQEDFCEGSYSFVKDGSMVIRDGWDLFVEKNDLKVWMKLVMVSKLVSGVLTIFVKILN